MKMLGSIHSQLQFTAHLNATALRTDWDATRQDDQLQLLHDCMPHANHDSAAPTLAFTGCKSAAPQLSLLCDRMAKTVIDALICLAHICFSLAMQPLFSAFASVALQTFGILCDRNEVYGYYNTNLGTTATGRHGRITATGRHATSSMSRSLQP
jgi:hypothetical protein